MADKDKEEKDKNPPGEPILIQLNPGTKVKDKWIIEKKLGEGAFGAVYKVKDDKNNVYALKVESVKETVQILKMEVAVLLELDKANNRHFCKIYDRGQTDEFSYVVMTFVGRSLADLRMERTRKKFSHYTACNVAMQCLEALEDLHNIGYLHRDVKPANYTIGRPDVGEIKKVYVLDFGMARKYIHEDGTIKQPRKTAAFRGTPKYAPISCHRMRELCRLDDVESWFYMMVEFTTGSLPWEKTENLDEVCNKKRFTRHPDGRKAFLNGCPEQYWDIQIHVDTGKFFDEPKYSLIYGLLRLAIIQTKCKPNEPYDWEKKEKDEPAEPVLIQLDQGTKVKDKWIIDKKLGEGAFGAVYRVKDEKNDLYALKVESVKEQIQILKMEVAVLLELAKANNRHFCKIYDRGQTDEFSYVVMTFVGRSLADLRNEQKEKRFSHHTAAATAIQCLEALEDLHNIGYLHRDVKPANYTVGRPEVGEFRKIYVLDFGMARKYIHEDGTIKQPRKCAGFRGTVKYAPISCHRQRELCRLDDCESWFYMIVEFTRGWLPWELCANMDAICKLKKESRVGDAHKDLMYNCPEQYSDIMRAIDGGKFFDEPPYERIYNLLKTVTVSAKAKHSDPYDWEKPKEEKKDEVKKDDGKKEEPKKDDAKKDQGKKK
uniref:non-specific serine/threonine protein kinase n=1 Tax=Parastrongyloides trichosuri TaxID=131310 RepID=A0A0N4ZM89_PARTI